MAAGWTRRSLGWGSPVGPDSFWPAILVGAIVGPIVAIALMPTVTLRRRGGIAGHYLSWIVACGFTGTVVFFILERSVEAVEFGALAGCLAGLGLGAWSRATGIGVEPPSSGPGENAPAA